MWTYTQHPLAPKFGHRYQLLEEGRQLPFRAVLQYWRENEAFRQFFVELLQHSPIDAAFWETPPITMDTVDRPFEFVLGPSPMLERVAPEASTFADRFVEQPGLDVIGFANLGGDAELVVPRPLQAQTDYAHLMKFLRSAPARQIHQLWQRVGERAEKLLSPRPRWISTAGLGVYWLHVRLDTRPKYYRYEPYKG